MPFVHPSLLWALPLVGVPVLIHLINMLRHRRVEWAAMEFLLVSQRKHRTWIILKQLLLLLLRMAAVAAVVLMAAQPLLRNQWGALLGGSKTHHIVLLDDSFSMSDRAGETTAFDTAKQVISHLVDQASQQGTPQTFTVLRFSQFARSSHAGQPDLIEARIDSAFPELLKKTLAGLKPSELASGPNEALDAAVRLPTKPEDEDRVLYLVSDFRGKDWDNAAVIRKTLGQLETDGVQLHLVNCVDSQRPNLAIVGLRPGPGTRAAGVPLFMDIAVRNFGVTAAKEVSVALEEDGRKRPAVVFEEILPGKTVTRRFQVMFQTAGEHQMAARLNPDAVAADNTAQAVVDFPASVPVLVIDGDAKAQDAYYLTTALAPGGNIVSGLKPLVETPRYLRDHPLENFSTIFLVNIERLDPAEIQALEAYCKAGGGVGFFLGERSRGEFYTNQLYRDGQGLFPLPLSQPTQLLVDRLDKAPDLEVTDHPMFRVFAGERNSLINTVVVEWYFGAAKNWKPDPDSTTKVIAKLRNGALLAVERRFGEGRVIAFLTKAAPIATPQGVWNNWARDNPSFLVAMVEMQSYLAASRQSDPSRMVGDSLEVRFPTSGYQSEVRFVLPQDKSAASVPVIAQAVGNEQQAVLVDTEESGIYYAELKTADGSVEPHRFALNVSNEEGDLRRLDSQQLADRLNGINYQYHEAASLAYGARQAAGFNLGERIMFLLITILIGEQLLAYAASYHPKGAAR